jgi:hypothetical protein
MSLKVEALHSLKELRQTDTQLVASVADQLQAQLEGNLLLSHEARELLEKLAIIFAVLRGNGGFAIAVSA